MSCSQGNCPSKDVFLFYSNFFLLNKDEPSKSSMAIQCRACKHQAESLAVTMTERTGRYGVGE